MSSRAFFTDEARARIGEVVQTIESKTRAEVVVAVQPRLTGLDAWNHGVAATIAYAGLLVFLYAPIDFSLWIAAACIPVLYVGVLGVLRFVDGLRRALIPEARQHARAVELARAAFHRLKIADTRERNGVLVHVTPHDLSVVVLADRGLDDVLSDAETSPLERSLHGGPRIELLAEALAVLGKHLAEHQPRGDKTDDELENVA